MLVNTLDQWWTFWSHQPWACDRTQGINPGNIICLLDCVDLGVQAPHWEPLQEAAARSFFGSAGLWNHAPPTMGIAAALFVLRRLFLSVGDKWGPMTPAKDLCGRSLIVRPITPSIWSPPWRLQIFVEIRRCQQDGSKSYRIDWFDNSRLPNH